VLHWIETQDGDWQGWDGSGKQQFAITPKGEVVSRVGDKWKSVLDNEMKIRVLQSQHDYQHRRPRRGEAFKK